MAISAVSTQPATNYQVNETRKVAKKTDSTATKTVPGNQRDSVKKSATSGTVGTTIDQLA